MHVNLVPSSMRSLQPGGDEFLYRINQVVPKVPLPAFVMGTLEDAIHTASTKKRPLLIYIHDLDKKKEVSAIFLENTVGNKAAVNMLVIKLNNCRMNILLYLE